MSSYSLIGGSFTIAAFLMDFLKSVFFSVPMVGFIYLNVIKR